MKPNSLPEKPIVYACLDEISFRHRNRTYGAYTLRKGHTQLLFGAFLSATVGMSLCFSVALLLPDLSFTNTVTVNGNINANIELITLQDATLISHKKRGLSTATLAIQQPLIVPHEKSDDFVTPRYKSKLSTKQYHIDSLGNEVGTWGNFVGELQLETTPEKQVKTETGNYCIDLAPQLLNRDSFIKVLKDVVPPKEYTKLTTKRLKILVDTEGRLLAHQFPPTVPLNLQFLIAQKLPLLRFQPATKDCRLANDWAWVTL